LRNGFDLNLNQKSICAGEHFFAQSGLECGGDPPLCDKIPVCADGETIMYSYQSAHKSLSLHVRGYVCTSVSMPDRTYDFVQLDVFTQMPLAGNPLAVFPDAHGLSDAEMQAVAREMNLSETTFIFPRDAAVESREGKKVRIFTVEAELPFAGHPTLGTALYLYASEPTQMKPNQITLDLKAGKIPVRFSANPGTADCEHVDGQVFGEMRQRDPEFGSPLSREDVARVIGIAIDEIASEWPIQPVSTGLTFTIVPFRNRQTLSGLKFSYIQAAEFLENSGANFFYFLCPERHDDRLDARARMFFYGGEDPATGSAAGCAASWMVQHGIADSEEQVVIRQGAECRRPSEMHVRARREGDRVTDVRVGGYAAEILRGTLTL
jgi:trans-2,3-dihydro-3-hydroxyanthranilate isomerase